MRLRSWVSTRAKQRSSEQARPAGALGRRGRAGFDRLSRRARAAADDHGRPVLDVAGNRFGIAAVRDPEPQSHGLRLAVAVEHIDPAGRTGVRVRVLAPIRPGTEGLELRATLGIEGGGDPTPQVLPDFARSAAAILV